MTAIDDWITDLQAAKYSDFDQNLIAKVATAIAALQAIQAGLVPAGPETQNTFYAGPAAAPAANPTFRAFATADFADTLALSILSLATSSTIVQGAAIPGTGVGIASASGMQVSGGSAYHVNGRSQIASGTDGIWTLLNNAATGFTRLNFGGTTASFPSISRSATALSSVLADASGPAQWIGGGTTTNDDAAAGVIGQYISSDVPLGAPVGLSTGAAKTMTSLALTAGDFDVTLQGSFINAVATATLFATSISLVDNTLDTTLGRFAQMPLSLAANSNVVTLPVAAVRISLAAPATINAVHSATFSAGAVSAFGRLSARRVR